MARYHAWIVSGLVWTTDRPGFEEYVYASSKPRRPQTHEEVARNLDLWAAALGALAAPPVNEVPA
jgi:hypothetical protein